MSKNKGKNVEPVIETPPAPQIITGKGIFILPDGSTYNGEWKSVDNKKTRHGQGELSIGAEKYVGNWIDDKMDGEGKYYFSSGSIYTGNFHNNFFHGQGEYLFFDGSKYVGEWQYNKMHGNGTFVTSQGIKYEGKFVNGMYDTGKSYVSLLNV